MIATRRQDRIPLNTNAVSFTGGCKSSLSQTVAYTGGQSMKLTFRTLALLSVLAIATAVLNAQSAPESIWGPAQYIRNAEFQRLIDDGTLTPINADLIADQDEHARRRERENREVVYEYLRRNPDLTQLAALVATRPSGPNVAPTADGNYVIQVPNADGTSIAIETMGEATKFENIANSIRASEDRAQQLALYQSFYNGYVAFYGQVCAESSLPGAGGPAPGCSTLPQPGQLTSPGALTNSSLADIQRALGVLGSNAPTIIRMVPVQTGVLSCAFGTPGSSTVANQIYFGDMTNSYGCAGPASNGIVANFNWLNRNLLSPVKMQGHRGICHIFGATSAVEELVARDTSCIVNLSEQDFQEHVRLFWSHSLFGEGGDPGGDLQLAAQYNYRFAWENQWDYNPSYFRLDDNSIFAFDDSCTDYPYPALEPGCSNTSSQVPIYCTYINNKSFCAYGFAMLTGSNSPYMVNGAAGFWNSNNTPLSIDNMLLTLAFNNAVVIAFNVTFDFEGATNGYVPYIQADLPTSIGGHAVHVVGYIDNSDLAANPATASAPPGAGGGYFIVKNSWGTCAGDVGYYYVPLAYFQAEILAAYGVSQETN